MVAAVSVGAIWLTLMRPAWWLPPIAAMLTVVFVTSLGVRTLAAESHLALMTLCWSQPSLIPLAFLAPAAGRAVSLRLAPTRTKFVLSFGAIVVLGSAVIFVLVISHTAEAHSHLNIDGVVPNWFVLVCVVVGTG